MSLFKSLQSKLLTLLLLSVGVPLATITVLNYRSSAHLADEAAEGLLTSAGTELEDLARSLARQVGATQRVLENEVRTSTRFAQALLSDAGGVVVDDASQVSWKAVNQFDNSEREVKLPRVNVGDEWLGQVDDPARPVPFIDEVSQLSGASVTVFQRMNDAGDMLRVGTSVINARGRRAIGTYIPAVNPDGKPNPVVSSVLGGKSFTGRAFVVDQWCFTTYLPLLSRDGKVTGMLYLGRPESTVAREILEMMQAVRIGKTGYVFVINTRGADRGRYVLSSGGKRNGEIILNQRDANGREVIREMIEMVEASPASVSTFQYDWRNGDEPLRKKVAKLAYYEPWDWMIGASTYEDEFLEPVRLMDEMKGSAARQSLLVTTLCILAACGCAAWFVRRIVGRIHGISNSLNACASETGGAAGDVSRASEQLANGAAQQAAGIEETSAALGQLAAQSSANAERAVSADAAMREAVRQVDEADSRMHALTESMRRIADVSSETQKIVRTIDEIAFQTNILALNAAVEAARAGEAGAGFAVVANEVRSLAQRAAQAAQTTSQLITEAATRINEGCEMADGTGAAFQRVRGNATNVAGLVNQIAEASREQESGHKQIEMAIESMNSVVQANAAAAEQSAAAAQELFAQSGQLRLQVNMLEKLVTGVDQEVAAAQPPQRGPGPVFIADGAAPMQTTLSDRRLLTSTRKN